MSAPTSLTPELLRGMPLPDHQQGADKNSKGDVRGSNVALAFVTGRSGKERDADDYKVTLTIDCR